MDIGLQIFEYYEDENNISKKKFRFAVVDQSKSKSYPSNFICILPTNIGGKAESAFTKVFKDNSLEQAKSLLKKAYDKEDDSEVKAEIERRLKLLEPKGVNQIKCSNCGRLFQSRQIRKFRNSYCEECIKKRFGNQP